eukprot:scaffold1237_cov403-Prasinococcus_capsulatus_cf.AAC.20
MHNYVSGMRTRARASASAGALPNQSINNAANIPQQAENSEQLKRHAAHMGKRGSDDAANRPDASLEGGIKKNRTALADISNTTQSQPARIGSEQRLEASAGPVTRSRASLGGSTGRGTARNLVNAFPPEGAHRMDLVMYHRLGTMVFTDMSCIFLACAVSVASWRDVDAPDSHDPQFCTQYVNDIYAFLRSTEKKRSHGYMESQTDINHTMRGTRSLFGRVGHAVADVGYATYTGILVDWLVEVAEEYRLAADTLYFCVNYIDRVLAKMPVQRNKLQLVGVTCMLIAAKYEEIYAPQVDEFVYITDNTYSREEVLEMERKILELLDFTLTGATTKTFVRRFLRAAESDNRTDFLITFLAELTLLDYDFLHFKQSEIAASCVLLAIWTTGHRKWTSTLQHYTGYRPSELKECATALHAYHKVRMCRMPLLPGRTRLFRQADASSTNS